MRFDIFMNRKQYALAAAAAHRAAELEPKFFEAQHTASTACAHEGKFERSVKIMDGLIAKILKVHEPKMAAAGRSHSCRPWKAHSQIAS